MARQRSTIIFATLLALLGELSPPAAARAQLAAEPAGYRALIDAALREYQASHFEEARSLFQRAHQLAPNARTHRGIGMTEFELRNYRACIVELRAALASDVRPLDEKLHTDTEDLLARAARFITELRVSVEPHATSATVDGLPVVISAGEPLLLQVGDHLIELHSRGFLPERRHVVARGGDKQTLQVTFTHPLLRAEKPEERHWYKSPWLWSTVGVVAAGAAAGGVLVSTRSPGTGSVDSGTSGAVGRAP